MSIGETTNHAKFHHKLTKFGTLIERALVYKVAKIGELWLRGSSWDAKILKVQRIFVTLFLYIVWLSATKFGVMRGMCT